jgi:RNA polymerase sigma factor (sigma-70 family)
MATAQLGTVLRYVHKLAAGNGSLERADRQLLDDFSARRDEAAFAALVARHGSMVLRVCRRVLNHEQDAEDAFQATFLILARKCASIRKPEALAEWLHGVAYRTALELKRSAARRRGQEARLWNVMRKAAVSPTWDDVQSVLDEEIQRLREPFRAAFVLCVLEGKSGPRAAAELGVKEGTVCSRLRRARQLLQKRLARRGIKLGAVLAALSVVEGAGRASVTAALVDTALRIGLSVAAGNSAAGVIPSHIAALAAGVTRAMFVSKAKIGVAVLFAVGLFAAGVGALAHQALASPESTVSTRPQAAESHAKRQAVPAADDAKEETIAYGGRVLGADGKPVAGVKLYMTLMHGYYREPFPSTVHATSEPDGRFEFKVPKTKFADHKAVVAALAANHGIGWLEVPADGKKDDLTLRLANDNVPITGQIVDLEGKPVPRTTFHVLGINAATGEDLGPWLEAAGGKNDGNKAFEDLRLNGINVTNLNLRVTTDAEGRFRLTGIGRDRLVSAQLDGPTIASQYLHLRTRPGMTMEIPNSKGKLPPTTTYYGANFRHVAAPTKLVAGVVRDKDTGKPLAGVTIESSQLANDPIPGRNIVQTTTDAQGRYRLTGLPKGDGNKIRLLPRDDQPYVSVHAVVLDSPGFEPVTIDFELKRGIWIEGKLTDKVTGKPVQGFVDYFAQENNPNIRDHPGFEGPSYWNIETKKDGSFRIVGLPGPGLLAVHYDDHHLLAPERDDEYGIKELGRYTSPRPLGLLINYTALARIDPANGVDSVKRNVTLDAGWTFTGTVLGPDGKPLAGARAFGLHSRGWNYEAMKTAEFSVRAFNPRQPRDVFFQDPEKGLVGVAQPPKENGGAVTVLMEQGAVVTGRLIDPDGKPRAGVELKLTCRLKKERFFVSFFPDHIKTDGEGRFRITALMPQYEYRLSDGKGDAPVSGGLRLGQTKNLGDVQMKPAE